MRSAWHAHPLKRKGPMSAVRMGRMAPASPGVAMRH